MRHRTKKINKHKSVCMSRMFASELAIVKEEEGSYSSITSSKKSNTKVKQIQSHNIIMLPKKKAGQMSEEKGLDLFKLLLDDEDEEAVKDGDDESMWNISDFKQEVKGLGGAEGGKKDAYS